MASIKMGAIVTDIRGKLGGHVFQKGNQSRVLKTNFKTKKTTNFFTSLRTNQLALVRTDWRNLSVLSRNEWKREASKFNFKNRFGDVITYNGFQLFIKLQFNLRRTGVTSVLVPSTLDSAVARSVLTGYFIAFASGATESSGTSPSGYYRTLFFVQRVVSLDSIPDLNKFVNFFNTDNINFTSSDAYVAIQNAIGPIAVGEFLAIGQSDVNSSGFINPIQSINVEVINA